jgi:hypothetical protein
MREHCHPLRRSSDGSSAVFLTNTESRSELEIDHGIRSVPEMVEGLPRLLARVPSQIERRDLVTPALEWKGVRGDLRSH